MAVATIPPRWTKTSANIVAAQINDYMLRLWRKTSTWILEKDPTSNKYQAISGQTGKIVYGGTGDAGGKDGDDGAAVFQAIIDALPAATGGKIYVSGHITVADCVIFPATLGNVVVIGDGLYSTFIDGVTVTGTGDGGDPDYLRLGYAVAVLSNQVTFEKVAIYGGVYNLAHNTLFSQCALNQAGAGKWLLDIESPCYGLTVRDCLVGSMTGEGGILAHATTGNDITNIVLDTNVIANSPNYLIKFQNDVANAAIFRGCRITNNWIEPNQTWGGAAHGIYAYNTYDLKIADNFIAGFSDGSHDLVHLNGDDVGGGYFNSVTNNIIRNWSTADKLRYALYINNNVHFRVTDNPTIDCYGATYDLCVDTGPLTSWGIITGNDFHSSKVTIGGLNHKVRNNLGFVTEAWLSAMIPSGANCVLGVAHGLAAKPTRVQVTGTHQEVAGAIYANETATTLDFYTPDLAATTDDRWLSIYAVVTSAAYHP